MRSDALLISTRRRVVWTKDERKLVDRVAKLFNRHGDKFQLVCGSALCPEPSITMAVDDHDQRSRVLRCGCTDREFSHIH